MSGKRNSQHTEFPKFIRTGVLEDVKRCFLTNGKLDKLLLKKKFEPFEETALHLAVKYRREDVVEWLLKLEADIHATDHFSRTALHTATNETEDVHSHAASASDTTTDDTKDNNIIKMILSCKGVDVNARDTYGNTPVKLAAEKGKLVAVRLLLENEADITIADNADNTTLHVAAKKGHKEVLDLLLKTLNNSNTGIIGKQNKDRNTPLHSAVTSKCPQCVALLLNAGADSTMEVKNEQGQTATDLAKENGKEAIIKLLKNPQSAKEFLPEKLPKSVNSISLLGRGGSVESDSSAISLGAQLQCAQNTTIQVNANHVILHQQYNANISGGNNAVGPGAVVNAQHPTAVVPRQSGPPDESTFGVTVNGGNACVGVRPVINVTPGTPRTPSTAGSMDGPFFPGPQENEDTSSGFPTENPSPFGAREVLPRPFQEESSSDKLNESARRPVQEQSAVDKLNEAAHHPVQEESSGDKLNESTRHPVQEKSSGVKLNESARRPVQEESAEDKLNESARRPVQEESAGDKLNESVRRPVRQEFSVDKLSESARWPVQEEKAVDKLNESSNLPSLSRPVQEEWPTDKSNVSSTSQVREMPEQKPAQKEGELINSSHMGNQPRTEGGGPDTSSTGERGAEPIGPANDIGTVDNAAVVTVDSVRDGTLQEAIAPFDAVETASNSGKALSRATSYKPDEASKQTWQPNISSGTRREASPVTRAVPKVAQGRLLQEVKPSNDMFDLDSLCGAPPESQVKLSSNRNVAPHRVSLTKSSGTSLLVTTPEGSKSAVRASINVPKSMASSYGADAGPCSRPPLAGPGCGSSSQLPCSSSPSCSKESPHRKAQHSREDAIPDSTLPADAAANAATAACNGEASFPGNHHGDNPVGTSQPNLSSGAQSSAHGNSTTIVIDDNPENDRKGDEKCEPGCRLM